MPSLPDISRTFLMNSGVESSASPRFLRWALSAVRRNVMVATPGISSGYWKARNKPGGGALVRRHVEDVLAVELHFAGSRRVIGLAGEHISQRRLAGAVRAHDGVHLARIHGEVETLQNFLAVDFDVQVLDFQERHRTALSLRLIFMRDRQTPVRTYPTEPSRLTEISFCASTANSIGNCCNTSLTKPLTTSAVASSAESPRWRQ